MDNISGNIILQPENKTSSVLVCPNCGEEYLHHEGIVSYDRTEDSNVLLKTKIKRYDVHSEYVNSEGSGNPSDRRDGVAIHFSCECCYADMRLTLAQHKGRTFVAWEWNAGEKLEETDEA